VIVTIIPIGFTLLLILIYTVQTAIIRLISQPIGQTTTQFAPSGPYLKVFLVLSFLFLPGISIFIFRTFSCIDVDPEHDGGSYLQADYSISCESNRYRWGRYYANGMIFLYPLGIPGLYFWLLYSNRYAIQARNTQPNQNNPSIDHLQFLFSGYDPLYWYWEVVETIRRILLTGILVLFRQGSGLQLVVAFVISITFLKLYGHFGKLSFIFVVHFHSSI
jgi:hypothetical protein